MDTNKPADKRSDMQTIDQILELETRPPSPSFYFATNDSYATFADGTPTPGSVALHVLVHPEALEVHDGLVRARDAPGLDTFLGNAATRISLSRKGNSAWITHREGSAAIGLAAGAVAGVAFGLAAHPEILSDPIYVPSSDWLWEGMYRTLVARTGAVLGAISGVVLNTVRCTYEARAQAKELTLDSAEHDLRFLRRQDRKRIVKNAVITALAALSLHNAALTYLNHEPYSQRTAEIANAPVTYSAPRQETPTVEPAIPPLLSVKIEEISMVQGYAPSQGEFVYGLACGEGLSVADKRGRVRQTSRIEYVRGADLKTQFLADNSGIQDINRIPATGQIKFRDVNGDGQIRFAHPRGWNCSPYAR